MRRASRAFQHIRQSQGGGKAYGRYVVAILGLTVLVMFVGTFRREAITVPEEFRHEDTGESIPAHSIELRFQPDGVLLFTERLDVLARGNLIKHGVIRRLPANYQSISGQSVPITYSVSIREVSTQGTRISGLTPKTEETADGVVSIYLGAESLLLAEDAYSFDLQYRASGLDKTIESDGTFNWVIGGPWGVNVGETTFIVKFPEGIPTGELHGELRRLSMVKQKDDQLIIVSGTYPLVIIEPELTGDPVEISRRIMSGYAKISSIGPNDQIMLQLDLRKRELNTELPETDKELK